MIKRYSSISAMRADYIRLTANKAPYMDDGAGRHWYNDESIADTLRLAQTGDTRLVSLAQTLIDKLDQAIVTPRRVVESVVAGGWPCVADALVGHPRSMRRVVRESIETAPITILATGTSSAGIYAKTLQQRGATILALVMALCRSRPVSLYFADVHTYAGHKVYDPNEKRYGSTSGRDGETVILTEINTAPLDLATACYALTSSGFCRRMSYELSHQLNGWTNSMPKHSEIYLNDLARRAGFDPAMTLFIPAIHLHDELLTQPLAWIQKQIKRFTAFAEELVI